MGMGWEGGEGRVCCTPGGLIYGARSGGIAFCVFSRSLRKPLQTLQRNSFGVLEVFLELSTSLSSLPLRFLFIFPLRPCLAGEGLEKKGVEVGGTCEFRNIRQVRFRDDNMDGMYASYSYVKQC